MTALLWRSLTASVLLGISAFAAAEIPGVSVYWQRVFEGATPIEVQFPIAVEIENEGRDAQGYLRVRSDTFQMDYPVSLPGGSKKRVITYPSGDPYGSELTIELVTNRGALVRKLPPEPATVSGNHIIGMISDTPGDLTFLRAKGNRGPDESYSSQEYADSYAKPEYAPTRASGYSALGALVLGNGAERLSDEAVLAIKNWVLTGGVLFMVGGASSPVTSDPRWADVRPVKNLTPKNLKGSVVLQRMGGAPLEETFGVMAGEPVEQATVREQNGVTIVAERPHGLGKVVFLAFNPFETPLSTWAGRGAMLRRLAAPQDMRLGRSYIASYQRSTDPYGYGASYYYGGAMSVISGDEPMPNNPFRTSLPPTSKVGWILLAYFLLVVPVNMLVLRKMKRGELAWVTAPLISVAFAGAFFSAASDLYKIGLSTSTSGVLLAEEGQQQGMFIGGTQMFFPKGGQYDLKMEGVEAVSTQQDFDYFAGRTRTNRMAEMQPVDTGQVQISRMQTSNLAFRQIYYRQVVSAPQVVQFEKTPGGMRVRNATEDLIRDCKVIHRGRMFWIGEIKPGESREVLKGAKSVDAATEESPQEDMRMYGYMQEASANSLAILTKLRPMTVFTCTLPKMTVGPPIGQQVRSESGVTLAVFTDKGGNL